MSRLPAHLIRRAHQRSTALFTAHLTDEDLTSIQYAAMIAACDITQPDLSSVAAAIGVDRATLGAVIDRLERKQLVARCPAAGDRRLKVVEVTAAGRALLDRVERAVMAVQTDLLSPLDAAEQHELVRLLEKTTPVA